MHGQLAGEACLLRVLGTRRAAPSALGFAALLVQPAIPKR